MMPNVDPKQFTVLVRDLGASEYSTVLEAMQGFTRDRDENRQEEIRLTEYQPVFTQGQAGKAEHLLAPGSIPDIQSDRGVQVTYHGPGQITAYLMLDLRRHKLGVRDLVCGIEHSIQHLLKTYGIFSQLRDRAPGVYVNAQKIAQLGLRVRRGCSYHGLSLNVDMDLEPFSRINPCGLTDITTTHMAAFCAVDLQLVKQQLLSSLSEELGLELRS